MNCPECDNQEVIVLHTDSIECSDCGAIMRIGYCVCPKCYYSLRVNNVELLDEMDVDSESLAEVVETLDHLLSDDFKEWPIDHHIKDMLSLLHPCVKCGSVMTAYNQKAAEYECLACGFKWEILNYE